jgi:crossover junction endodeoxyribonuclease RuvC
VTALKVAAFDLSLAATGIACTHDSKGQPRLFARTLPTSRTAGKTTAMDHKRVHRVFAAVRNTVLCKPDLVVIEWLPQFDGHGDASLRLAELGAVVRHWLWGQGVPYVDVQPVHLQMYATGKGGSKKETVREAVTARYGQLVHIGTQDEADAMVLLSMALHAYGQPLADVPETHRRALDAYRGQWPTLGGTR